MQIDITPRRMQDLAKRLRRNLDIRGDHRAVLDQLAIGLGFKSYAAMKAAMETQPKNPGQTPSAPKEAPATSGAADSRANTAAGESWSEMQERLHASPAWTDFTKRLAEGVSPRSSAGYVGELHLGDDRGLTEPGNTSATTSAAGHSRAEVIEQLANAALSMLRPLNHEDLRRLSSQARLDRAVELVMRGHWWVVPRDQAEAQPNGEAVEAAARPDRSRDIARVSFQVHPLGYKVVLQSTAGEAIETWRAGNRRDDPRHEQPSLQRADALTYPEMLLQAIRAAEDLADAHDLDSIEHDVMGEESQWDDASPSAAALVAGSYYADFVRGTPTPDAPAIATPRFTVHDRQQARRLIVQLLQEDLDLRREAPAAPRRISLDSLRHDGPVLRSIKPADLPS
ncbi:hypothetical protein CKO28_00625 [Rhodovibrio sodomensis]|uniref:Large polyvalent protein-associated domain-containing protein n=1 Tax=Rhodovibrio sodomensis TaxID=1088 RepID=A0ABS1DAT9_9PROT|nr:hypothetical protein [Rhodovibrio sodomensis]MBK1666545.1 hypothetical protein [Rhodovibrio sodomensis]